jgi:hypothetical protein
MSNWIDQDLFKSFLQEEEKASEQKPSAGPRRTDIVYPTFKRGEDENSFLEYVGRLLPNINSTVPSFAFKVKFHYHMFQQGEKWIFVLCPKTWDIDAYCPFCSASMKLYNSGVSTDKKRAPRYYRKDKFAVNYYCKSDPRDSSREEKLAGKVWVLEFPSVLNSKITAEQKEGENTRGLHIYNPGKDGYDIIVRVKSTKPSKDKKVFHNYDDSTFGLKATPLAKTDEEIQTIMDSRHDLVEYIKSMERTPTEIVEILKEEMIWEMVKADFKKHYKVDDVKDEPINDTPTKQENKKAQEDEESPPWEDNTPTETENAPADEDDNIEIDRLLAEAGIS